MSKLSDDLKRMLAGLACQEAGEFLPMQQKMAMLATERTDPVAADSRPVRAVPRPATHRIALISDGRGLGAPLDYAMEAALRQGARVDLLVHGTFDARSLDAMTGRLGASGIPFQVIRLGVDTVEDIATYICNHPSLIFLVAMPDDSAARTLVEEVIPRRGGRMPVPLVLIEPGSHAARKSLSAA